MTIEISPEFLIGSFCGALSMLATWVFSLSGKVNTLIGRFDEHVQKRR